MSRLDMGLEEIRPTASRIYICCLPQRYRSFISDLFDAESSTGLTDYRMLGEHLGSTPGHIQALRSRNVGRSVTLALLNENQHKVTIWKFVLILQEMGVRGVAELLDCWNEILALHNKEQRRFWGGNREGLQNTEHSCHCPNCQVPHANVSDGHHSYVADTLPPYSSAVTENAGAVASNLPGHPQGQYPGHYPILNGHGSRVHGPDPFNGYMPFPADGITLPRQTEVNCASLNIPPRPVMLDHQTLNKTASENKTVPNLLRLSSNEDNCAFELDIETDCSQDNEFAGCEYPGMAAGQPARQAAEGRPEQMMERNLQESKMESNGVCSKFENLKLEESLDWIPPDMLSLDSFEDGEVEIVQDTSLKQASITCSSGSEQEVYRLHNTANSQMAPNNNNGNQTSQTAQHPPPGHNRIFPVDNSPVKGYSGAVQGCSELRGTASQQTMRKMPYSTTEAYYRMHEHTAHISDICPPPQRAANCNCGGYSWASRPGMCGPGLIEHPHIDWTGWGVPVIPTYPQALHSLQGFPGPTYYQPELNPQHRINQSLPQVVPSVQGSPCQTYNPVKCHPVQKPGNRSPPQSAGIIQEYKEQFYHPSECHPRDRSGSRPPPQTAHSPHRSLNQTGHEATGKRSSPSPTPASHSPQGSRDGAPGQLPPGQQSEDQQDVRLRDLRGRRGEFGKTKGLSHPLSNSGSQSQLQRQGSDGSIQYINECEANQSTPPKFVFMTGGESTDLTQVDESMWRLCKELYSKGIPVVAALPQRGIVACPGNPLRLRWEQRQNVRETLLEYFRQATCVLLVASPGYKDYVDRNSDEANPSDHRLLTRLIYTEMMDEHCRKNFCKNVRFFPVKLTALRTRTNHLPDWMASTLIYTFPAKKDELINHLRQDLEYDRN